MTYGSAEAVTKLLAFLLGESSKCSPVARAPRMSDGLASLGFLEHYYFKNHTVAPNKLPLLQTTSFIRSLETMIESDERLGKVEHDWEVGSIVFCAGCNARWKAFRA